MSSIAIHLKKLFKIYKFFYYFLNNNIFRKII